MLPVVDGNFGTLFWTGALLYLTIAATSKLIDTNIKAINDSEQFFVVAIFIGVIALWALTIFVIIRHLLPAIF